MLKRPPHTLPWSLPHLLKTSNCILGHSNISQSVGGSRESGKSRISHGLLDEVMLRQMQLCAGDGEAVDDDYDELGGEDEELVVITNVFNKQKITKRLKNCQRLAVSNGKAKHISQRAGHASMYCGGSSRALAVGKAEYIFNMSLHVLRPLLPFFGPSLVHKHVSFQPGWNIMLFQGNNCASSWLGLYCLHLCGCSPALNFLRFPEEQIVKELRAVSMGVD